MVQAILLRAVPGVVPAAGGAGEQPAAAEHRGCLQQEGALGQLEAGAEQVHAGVLQLGQQHPRDPLPAGVRGGPALPAAAPAAPAAAPLLAPAAPAAPPAQAGPARAGGLRQPGDAVLLARGADGGRARPNVSAQLRHGPIPDAGPRLFGAAGLGHRPRGPPGQQGRCHLVHANPDPIAGEPLHPLPRHADAHGAALHPAGPYHLLQSVGHFSQPPSPAARPCPPSFFCPLWPDRGPGHAADRGLHARQPASAARHRLLHDHSHGLHGLIVHVRLPPAALFQNQEVLP